MGALRNELYHSLSLIYKFHAVAVAHHLPFTTLYLPLAKDGGGMNAWEKGDNDIEIFYWPLTIWSISAGVTTLLTGGKWRVFPVIRYASSIDRATS